MGGCIIIPLNKNIHEGFNFFFSLQARWTYKKFSYTHQPSYFSYFFLPFPATHYFVRTDLEMQGKNRLPFR